MRVGDFFSLVKILLTLCIKLHPQIIHPLMNYRYMYWNLGKKLSIFSEFYFSKHFVTLSTFYTIYSWNCFIHFLKILSNSEVAFTLVDHTDLGLGEVYTSGLHGPRTGWGLHLWTTHPLDWVRFTLLGHTALGLGEVCTCGPHIPWTGWGLHL